MRILSEAICKVCKSVLCCSECRQRHEIKHHAIVDKKLITMSIGEKNNEDSKILSDTKQNLETIHFFCPICKKQPLIHQLELDNELLAHIELYHLPLRCRKCFKTYNKVNDLKDFSKCVHPTIVCQNHESLAYSYPSNTEEVSKLTVTKALKKNSRIMQNSPLGRQDNNESHLTPISLINMRWKAKTKVTHEEFISDSVSSIKNISSISNSSVRRSSGIPSGVNGKVIRCSSTPVHLEMVFAKPKEPTFNASGGGYMSSIQYTSGCESDHSPVFPLSNSQHIEPVNRYMKFAGYRPKMSAVTPLRQVMSKSIQKAFAEHGVPQPTSITGCKPFQHKNMFDSTSSPELNNNQSPQQPPLDLRLSPAIRRRHTENEQFLKNQISSNQQNKYDDFASLRHDILLSSQKLTTESIVITCTEHLSSVSSSAAASSANYSMRSLELYPRSTNSSYQSATSYAGSSSLFKSCSSVEIITATTAKVQQLQSFDEENIIQSAIPPLTPITRIPGAVLHRKKIIKFETPQIDSCDLYESQNSPNEVYFTPNATPICYNNENVSIATKQRKLSVKQNLNGRFSPKKRPSIKECVSSTANNRIENISNDLGDRLNEQNEEKLLQKLDNLNENKNVQSRGLWSLMSSVMRLPSRNVSNTKESLENKQYSNGILRRCASIAGSLIRSKSLADGNELSSLKRKRSNTIDNQPTSAYLNNSETASPSSGLNSSKRFRIQARRPIDRMRLNS